MPGFNANGTHTIAWVTGPQSPNATFSRFGISGTDLGISWLNSSGQTLMAFGDTFGNCSVSGQEWRHNVLLRSNDTNLADGISVPDGVEGDTTSGTVIAGRPNFAQQLIPSLGIAQVEVTDIPTAAISIGDTQYINYMSVRSWGSAGNWVTNFSGIATSHDNGQTWDATNLNTIRVNAGITIPTPTGLPSVHYNDGKFQQSAYVEDPADGYIYQFGTPNGRFGAAYLARFRPGDIMDFTKYQYWTGKVWSDTIDAIPDDGSARVINQPVTELSVAYSRKLGKFVMLDGDNGIRLRTATTPTGPWSAPVYLVPPGAIVLYGPMMQPTSPALLGTGNELYFNASRWSDYNVMLLGSDLSKLHLT
ncbi:hypothetical protein GCM10027169_31170 [Gordonia jinhuaensis]|uniref:DUF4185 domain-containing protein n=1 Tax=Gordonia jinhuaensis TaxID=1517702 RepID=A0A916T9E9_9ACTN|nr:hypothetical protein GCM10011489_23660 [Gordonia jinhuaensis]